MDNFEIKLRRTQRDYLLERVMSESPVQQDTILAYLILKKTLANGHLVDDDDDLDRYVEIDSMVTIKTSFGFKFGLRIVRPEEGNIQCNKLSVLSPLGCALFGHKEGEKVKWYFQGDEEYAELVRVTRPRCELNSVSRLTDVSGENHCQ